MCKLKNNFGNTENMRTFTKQNQRHEHGGIKKDNSNRA